jgi:hypothetical protein
MTSITVRVSEDSKRLRTTTPGAIGYSLKQVAAACLLSGLIAGAVTTLTTESSAGRGSTSAFSVNRIDKTDRLPLARDASQPRSNATSTPAVRLQGRVQVGCDSGFSPIVNAARANFIRDCLT